MPDGRLCNRQINHGYKNQDCCSSSLSDALERRITDSVRARITCIQQGWHMEVVETKNKQKSCRKQQSNRSHRVTHLHVVHGLTLVVLSPHHRDTTVQQTVFSSIPGCASSERAPLRQGPEHQSRRRHVGEGRTGRITPTHTTQTRDEHHGAAGERKRGVTAVLGNRFIRRRYRRVRRTTARNKTCPVIDGAPISAAKTRNCCHRRRIPHHLYQVLRSIM